MGILTRCLAVGVFMLLSVLVLGQANFTTVVDQSSITSDQVVQVEYVVENAQKVENFNAPSFRNFTVIQGPVQSSGMSYVNGTLTQYKALVFLLRPRTTGKLIIPGAIAVIDGKRMQSSAVSIEVTKGTGGQSGSRRPLRFNLPETRVEADREFVLYPNESVAEKIKKNLFVTVEVNKKSCYVNEPIVATYKLYSRLRSESRVVKRPSYNGFSVYDMLDPEGNHPSVETLNGKTYNVHIIRQSQLFPLQPGDFVLDPVEVENMVKFIKASSEQDTYLEEIYDPQAETVEHMLTLASSSVNIHVKPLPANTPGSFDGAVGNFSIRASLKDPVIKTGDAARLVVEVKGKGNLPMINAPAVNWPAGFDAYDASAKEELHPENAPLSGIKTFEYVFTPRDTGNMVIPGIRFSFFDPVSRSYKTDSTHNLSLRIVPGTKKDRADATSNNKERASYPPSGRMWLWIAMGALVTLMLIAFVVITSRKRNRKLAPVTIKVDTSATAAAVPIRHDPLEKARRLLVTGNSSVFIKEVESVVWEEVSERLNIPPVSLNQQQVVTALQQQGADASTIKLFTQLMRDCESALYIPGHNAEDLQDILAKAEDFLSRI